MNAIEYWRQQMSVVTDTSVLTDSASVVLNTAINSPQAAEKNGWYETSFGNLEWLSEDEIKEKNIQGEYKGTAYMVFRGSRNEHLGRKTKKDGSPFDGVHYDGYLDAEDAINAEVRLYAPDGHTYCMVGYTMGSDFATFGAIHEGEYKVNYVIPGKRGALSSHWALNNGGNVPEMDQRPNNSPQAGAKKGTPYKDGIFIHSANASGYAGITKRSEDGSPLNGVSTGCLLLTREDWNKFNEIMKSVKCFMVKLNRTK